MKHFRRCVAWGLPAVAFLLSPVLVIFAVPLAVGVGLDVFDAVGGAPIAIVLSLPGAVLGARRVCRHLPWRQLRSLLASHRPAAHAAP